MDSVVNELSQITGMSPTEVINEANKKIRTQRIVKLNKDLMKFLTKTEPAETKKTKKTKKIDEENKQ